MTTRRKFMCYVAPWGTALFSSCATHKPRPDKLSQLMQAGGQNFSLPQPAEFRMTGALHAAGDIARAVRPYFAPVYVEVDYAPNHVDPKLDKDLGNIFAPSLLEIGLPFRVTRRWEAVVTSDGMAGGLAGKETRIKPAVRIKGSFQSAEIAEITKEKRGNLTGSVYKKDVDAEVGAGQNEMGRVVRVSFYAEKPDGESVAIPPAIYQLELRNTEDIRNMAIYVSGNGLGVEKKYIAKADASSALVDCVAACSIQLVGGLLDLPYWRASPVFERDERLVRTVQHSVRTMPPEDFYMQLRCILFSHGDNLDVSDEVLVTGKLTDDLKIALRKRGVNPSNRRVCEDLYLDLWENVPFQEGARRWEAHREKYHSMQQASANHKFLNG